MPLYELSPPPLQDIAEAKSSEEGAAAAAAGTLAPPSGAKRDDAVRSAGVGSDSENEAHAGSYTSAILNTCT